MDEIERNTVMTKILMNGCNGRMGRVICELAAENDCQIVAGIDKFTGRETPFPVYTAPDQCEIDADVIIDFSHPTAFDNITTYALKQKLPLIMCTTGLSEEQTARLQELSKEIPVFQSANMSLGVNLLIDLVKKAAKFLEGNFDIEIIERHHNQKLDAPSGTALKIAEEINSVLQQPCDYVYDRQSKREKRSKTEIGFHALRGGTIVGEHSVVFAGYNEVIELNHSATSRDVFAAGAVKAAKCMVGKAPGMYDMKAILDM